MSHTTTLKGVTIKDLGALRAAVAELVAKGVNCALVENVKPRMYYEDQLRNTYGKSNADLVLQLKSGRYDVGFMKNEKGEYEPVMDTYANHVSGQIGASCPMPSSAEGRAQHAIGQLLQSYQKHVAINEAVMAGYSVAGTEIDDKGNLQLLINV